MLVTEEQRKQPCRWKHLDEKQRSAIANGCGGKGGWVKAPNFRFYGSCNHHDFNYWLGGDEKDRCNADDQFYSAMGFDVKRLPWYRRPLARLAAWTYYKCVRGFGEDYFHYGPERTWSDVEAIT